jgi:hypothetical protein
MLIEPPSGPLWNAVAPMAPWPQPDEEILVDLAAVWRAAGSQFTEVGRWSLDGLAAAWSSDAGRAFVAREQTALTAAATSAGVMTGLGERVERFADEVMQLKLAIREVIAVNDGAYVGFTTLPAGVGGAFALAFVKSTADIVNQLVTDTAGRVSGQGASIALPPLPPPNATPQENAAFWDTLTESQKLQLAREHPEEVGRRDGFPAGYRDIANRALLDGERDRVAAELADLRARRDAGDDVAVQLQETEAKQRGLDDLAARIDSPHNLPPGVRHYLLGIDATGDGQAIVATGNPDTATNVATVVPGTANDLASFTDLITTADATYRAAEASDARHHPTENADPGSTAVIAWLGYDAPDDVLQDAPSPLYADLGEDDLDDFQEGLRESRDGAPSHNTVIGHSYGATVAGFAARDHTLPVDEFVSVAGPGLGVDNVEGLNLPKEHVWATESHNDLVGDVGVLNSIGLSQLGADPTGPFFGANNFDADDSSPFQVNYLNTDAHSAASYWREGVPNPGLETIGDIVAGNDPNER